MILQKQHPCQKDEDDLDEADMPEEENAEYDWLCIETALEVVASLSTALGPQFGELWKVFEAPVLKYASSQERFERSASIGTMADCIEGMGNGCTPFTKRMMTILLKRLRDEDPETKSNAAFGTGLLCLNSTETKETLPNYNAVFGLLEPMLDASNSSSPDESRARLVDNAAGCVARMIKASPQSVPLQQVLPRLVELLPLKNDFRENEPVYDTIISLYQAQEPTIMGMKAQVGPVVEQVLAAQEEQVSEETKGKLTQLLQFLKQ